MSITALFKKKNPLIKKERKEKFSPLTITMLVILFLYCALMFILLGWALLHSLQNISDESLFIPKIFFWEAGDPNGANEVELNKWALNYHLVSDGVMNFYKKDEWLWGAHYIYIFKNFEVSYDIMQNGEKVGQDVRNFGDMFLYTILYAGGGSLINTLVQCLTAYLCARYAYKLSGIVYGAVIVAMVLPVVGSLTSEIALARTLGLYDSIWGTWIMRANFLGMYFLVFHEMFKALPASYSEAATIDGANDWQILWKIGLPLAKNTFFTIFLLNFVAMWNDYQVAMVYLPSYPTLAVNLHWLQHKSDGLSTESQVKMAGTFILLVPVLTLFLCFHKRLMGNLTIGGVKG